MITQIIKLFSHIKKRQIHTFSYDINPSNVLKLSKNQKNLALYIHIPFCQTQCDYCTFLKFDHNKKELTNYYGSLKKELDTYLKNGTRFSQIYIGGGTPTIDMAELVEFIKYAKKKTNVTTISVETLLRHVTRNNLLSLKKAGVTRLSIGVQSFSNKSRTKLNRQKTSIPDIKNKITLAKSLFDTVNIDLIFNLPGQTLDEFKKEVDTFISLGDVQGTFYPLIPHKNSNKTNNFKKISYSSEKKYYAYLRNRLTKHNYTSSTSWCFSKGKKMSDEYIISSKNYVGIGCGSISLVNGYVYINTFSQEKYAELIKKYGISTSMIRVLTTKEEAQYYLLTHLFGTSLDKNDFKKQFGITINDSLKIEIYALKTFGWIKETPSKIIVTEKGMYYIGFMMREFFNAVSDLRKKSIKSKI